MIYEVVRTEIPQKKDGKDFQSKDSHKATDVNDKNKKNNKPQNMIIITRNHSQKNIEKRQRVSDH